MSNIFDIILNWAAAMVDSSPAIEITPQMIEARVAELKRRAGNEVYEFAESASVQVKAILETSLSSRKLPHQSER